MNQLFPRSNSSIELSSGKALQSDVVRLREDMFLVNAGVGSPRICMQNEITGLPIKRRRRVMRFENKVGYMGLSVKENVAREHTLKRLFIDIVAGESKSQERATRRLKDLVGKTDVVAGEPLLLLPRRFRKKRAWIEINKIARTKKKVKGFLLNRVKRGYLVAIAGFITYLPYRRPRKKKIVKLRFTIKSINQKTKKIVVLFDKKIFKYLSKRTPRHRRKKR